MLLRLAFCFGLILPKGQTFVHPTDLEFPLVLRECPKNTEPVSLFLQLQLKLQLNGTVVGAENFRVDF